MLKPVLLTGGTLASLGNPARKAGTRLISDGLLITTWAPIHLKRELDAWVWKDGSPHAGLKQVWNYLATYPYFSRLRDVEVLKETVKAGVRSRDYFGYADCVGDNGRYLGLVFAEPPRVVVVDDSSVLVRPEVAAAQTLEPSRGPLVDGSHGGETGGGTRIDGAGSSTAAAPPEPKRFYGTVKLNPARLGSSAGQIGDEIVQHLNALLGARAEIVLEIHVDVPNGIPDHVQRTVSENARTLRFDHFEFSEE